MMKLASIRPLTFVIAVAIGVPACQSRFLDPSDEWTDLHQIAVRPASLTLPIGFTRQMTAFVNGASNQTVTWFVPATNSKTLAVSASGEVRCLAEGHGSVQARSVADPYPLGVAAVVCEPPGKLITVGPKSLTFGHTFGSPAYTCPRILSTMTITNTGMGALTLSVSLPPSIKLTPEPLSAFSPRESRDFLVTFDCSVQASFVGAVRVLATGDWVSEEKTVAVTAVITR